MNLARRALLVGLESFDWTFLRPLLDSGRLPSLAGLLARGVHGPLRTLQPQFEPLLWTSIASGRRANAHRVLGSREHADGNDLLPLSALTRRSHCLWHHLTGHAANSLVVNWPVTYPAEPLRGEMVSDLFFRLAGTPDGLEPVPESAVSPAALAADIADLRLSPARLKREELEFFAEDLVNDDPMLPQLAVCLAEQISVHAVAMELLERENWRLGMLRYDFFAALGPRFMACHPPQLGWGPDDVFARYRNTMTHAATYLDHQLGHLLNHLDEDDFVMLVSERGLLSDQQRPNRADVAGRQHGAPWYREHGVFIMAGPGIEPGGQVQGAGLLDVAPTVMHALGLDLPQGLEGRVLLEAFTEPEPPSLAAMPAQDLERCGGHRPNRQLSQTEQELLSARWTETGIDPHRGDQPVDPGRIDQSIQFNLAAVHIDAGRPEKALPILESLHRHRPEDDRIMIHLSRCLQACGDLDRARELLERVVAHTDIRPHELMELARLHLAVGEVDQALASLFRAEQSEGDRPGVHCRIGQVYLQMERFSEAERAFTKALERGPDHAESHLGMARTRLGQGQVQGAIDCALKAVELNRALVQAHYWLGVALSEADMPEEAVTAFETVLSARPTDTDTLKQLIQVLEGLGQDDRASGYKARLRKIETADHMARSAREILKR